MPASVRGGAQLGQGGVLGVAGLLYLPARVALTLLERKMGGPGSPEQRRRSLTEIEIGVLQVEVVHTVAGGTKPAVVDTSKYRAGLPIWNPDGKAGPVEETCSVVRPAVVTCGNVTVTGASPDAVSGSATTLRKPEA